MFPSALDTGEAVEPASVRHELPDALAASAREAIHRGLARLESIIGPDGIWPSSIYRNLDLTGPVFADVVPFVAASGMLSLEIFAARSKALCDRTRAFLLKRMEYPGIWRYWPNLPPDVDDTSVCSLAAGSHPLLLFGANVKPLLANRDQAGRFRTWMTQDSANPVFAQVDSVVNANTLAWLGPGPDTAAAERWLETVVDERGEAGSTWYYPDPMDLYFAMARAHHCSPALFARLTETLAARIRERAERPAGVGDAVRAGQALTAWTMLGVYPGAETQICVVEEVLAAQHADGSWPETLLWQGPSPPKQLSVGFASEALSTALCVEGLERTLAAT